MSLSVSVMDSSDQTAHKIKNLQKFRTGHILNVVLTVYANHEIFKCDGNSGSLELSIIYLTGTCMSIKMYID